MKGHFGAILLLASSVLAKPVHKAELFTRGTGGVQVPLGAAAAYTIVAKTGISSIPTSSVSGDIAIAPAAMTYITGFSLMSTGPGSPSTSNQLQGKAWAPETTGSTSPAAANDMKAAYNNAAAQTPATQVELNGGALDGLIMTQGVYKWSTMVRLGVGKALTLSGKCGDVFIFQATGEISTGANSKIVLTGGLQANSIYWVGATSLTTGVGSTFFGIILTYTNVVFGTNAILRGAIYTQTQVALEKATVTPPLSCRCADSHASTCSFNGLTSTTCVSGYSIASSSAVCSLTTAGPTVCKDLQAFCDATGTTTTCKATYTLTSSSGKCCKDPNAATCGPLGNLALTCTPTFTLTSGSATCCKDNHAATCGPLGLIATSCSTGYSLQNGVCAKACADPKAATCDLISGVSLTCKDPVHYAVNSLNLCQTFTSVCQNVFF